MLRMLRRPDVLAITLAAAGTLLVTMGVRQSMGLFVSPLDAATGLGIATISLAMAVGQFTWGAVQPLAGIAADRWGTRAVLMAGVLLAAAGTALMPYMTSGFGLVVAIGLMSATGAGMASFSVLMGAAANRLPPESRGEASGVINAGSSLGQFVFAPIAQKLIGSFGMVGALWSLALATLVALPLIARLTARSAAPASLPTTAPTTAPRAGAGAPAGSASAEADVGAMAAIGHALKDRSYLLLHAGFFTCGFHVAFLVTHLPGEVNLCGLPASVASWSIAIIGLGNIAGSLYAGSCVGRYRSKLVLAWMYGSRAVLVALYLLAPRTEWTFYLFAVGLGFTWLATVPPTAAIVSKLFGVRHLATLFGLTLLSHQVGGFLGAWLGGLAITRFGDYTWMWYADMALAAFAALVNLPIREARVTRPAAQPA